MSPFDYPDKIKYTSVNFNNFETCKIFLEKQPCVKKNKLNFIYIYIISKFLAFIGVLQAMCNLRHLIKDDVLLFALETKINHDTTQ